MVEIIIDKTLSMKKKIAAFAILPVLGISLIGLQRASAASILTPGATQQDIATRVQSMFQSQADLLGVSVDDVKNAWAAGKSLKDLAAEKGISPADLAAKMKAAREAEVKTRLSELVSAGVITQAQADARLAAMQNKDAKMGPGFGMVMGMGHRHGQRHGRGSGL